MKLLPVGGPGPSCLTRGESFCRPKVTVLLTEEDNASERLRKAVTFRSFYCIFNKRNARVTRGELHNKWVSLSSPAQAFRQRSNESRKNPDADSPRAEEVEAQRERASVHLCEELQHVCMWSFCWLAATITVAQSCLTSCRTIISCLGYISFFQGSTVCALTC